MILNTASENLELKDQFMMARNYAKDVTNLFSRVSAIVTAMTVLQHQ